MVESGFGGVQTGGVDSEERVRALRGQGWQYGRETFSGKSLHLGIEALLFTFPCQRRKALLQQTFPVIKSSTLLVSFPCPPSIFQVGSLRCPAQGQSQVGLLL